MKKYTFTVWLLTACAAALMAGCQQKEIEVEVPVPTSAEVIESETAAAETEPSKAMETVEETRKAGSAEVDWSDEELLDQNVKSSILEVNAGRYLSGECVGEGHIILDTEPLEHGIRAYVLTMYGEYQFYNETYFVKSSGSGVIPWVMEFTKDTGVPPSGDMHISWPDDGSGYVESVQRLFPEELWEICITPTEEIRNELAEQERAYAEAYLKNIGREAQIGDYGDFEFQILTEVGVSVEASNRLLEAEKELSHYPNWVGTIEILEDGVRYVYRKDVDPAAGRIILSKYGYDTGEIKEVHEFDWQTGEKVEP